MPTSTEWLAGAVRVPSPNFAPGHQSREAIVMHYTAGYTATGAIETFRSRASKASAHFVVGTDGGLTQMVRLSDTAWHAGFGRFRGLGNVNRRSIGIEMVNPGYLARTPDGTLLDWRRRPVPPHRLAPFPGLVEAPDPWVGRGTWCWPCYPAAQLEAVEALIGALLRLVPAISAIVGHRDVDGVRRLKVDPGPAFPMARMRRLLPGAPAPG